jgi:hypothetical protein
VIGGRVKQIYGYFIYYSSLRYSFHTYLIPGRIGMGQPIEVSMAVELINHFIFYKRNNITAITRVSKLRLISTGIFSFFLIAVIKLLIR